MTIRVAAQTHLSPESVLEAAHDFSTRRAAIWPNVQQRYLRVHDSGKAFADVTEGTWVAGLFWERNYYDWSKPATVTATVIDSSIFEPGSTWELQAAAGTGATEVRVVVTRGFRRGPKGRIASTVHHTVGRLLWRWMLTTALTTIERDQRPGLPGDETAYPRLHSTVARPHAKAARGQIEPATSEG